MNGRVMTTLVLLVVASAALATVANAQEGLVALRDAGDIQAAAVARVGSELGPNQFGTNNFLEVIPISAFMPASSAITYSTYNSYLFTSTGGDFVAYLDLPPGTEVRQLCLFVYDWSSSEDITVFWGIQRFGDDTEGAGITTLAQATTSTMATPGYTTLCLDTGAWVPVNDLADVDGDGDTEFNKHRVRVVTPASGDMLRFSGLVVHWRRVISPAPATATFPNDVPTTHPYFCSMTR